jgi:hypothetical protein
MGWAEGGKDERSPTSLPLYMVRDVKKTIAQYCMHVSIRTKSTGNI